MDYEKKYKESMAKMSEFLAKHDGFTISKDGEMYKELSEIFPELKESEDEDILKGLISMCKTLGKTEWIAWLEKQGEQKSIWHNEDEEPKRGSLILLIMQSGTPIVAKIIEPNHTFNHGERWAYIDDLLEKQGEHKDIPADAILDGNKDGLIADTIRCKTEKSCEHWSDEQTRIKLLSFINTWGKAKLSLTGYNRFVNYLEKQGEQKPANTDNKFIRMRETKPKDISEFLDRLTTVEQEFLWEHIAKIRELDKEEQKPIDILAILKDYFSNTPKEQQEKDWEELKHLNNFGWELIEQQSVKVPKFKVGDFIQFNGMGHTRYTIKEVCGLSHYVNTCDKRMDMSYTDANFELVEQKPAEWSEEDEKLFKLSLENLTELKDRFGEEYGKVGDCINWLKAIKDRVQFQPQWKPSDEQMIALKCAITTADEKWVCMNTKDLESLYQDLKKLREE